MFILIILNDSSLIKKLKTSAGFELWSYDWKTNRLTNQGPGKKTWTAQDFWRSSVLWPKNSSHEQERGSIKQAVQGSCFSINYFKIMSDTAFLPEEKMTKLEENIKQVKQKIGINQVANEQEKLFEEKHNRVKRELECTICFDVPKVNIEIYSWKQQHLMWVQYKIRWFKTCPVCRQDFQMTLQRRNRLIESIIQSLN